MSLKSFFSGIFFDRQDRAVLSLVNRILDASRDHPARLFDPNLHPHGIEELVTPPVERMAYATVNLLRNLEVSGGQVGDRLLALQTLYDEVLSSAHSTLRRNTARVLMQIMKDIVRAHGDYNTQLRLAHDFRSVVHGTPRIVRRMLSRYHLPEMPEEWNQIAFDDHVYDVNTRGRKTPTHLIMDAWIKGLRSLTVAYEYCLEPEAVQEIMRAAEITGIKVRIGVEYQVPFYDRFITFFWIPRGFGSDEDFLSFLNEPTMLELMARGREVLDWRKEKLIHLLSIWNTTIRPDIEAAWGVGIEPLDPDAFILSCRGGNPTRLRLADCLFNHVLSGLEPTLEKIREGEGDQALLRTIETLTPDYILDEWLSVERYPKIAEANPRKNSENSPEILRMTPEKLTERLTSVAGGYRLVLGTTGLAVEDVAEILWECHGRVTHLEIFNMKGWVEGKMSDMEPIARLQRYLNLGFGPKVKQLIRNMAAELLEWGEDERGKKFLSILDDVHQLCEHYSKTPLKSRLGTSSASRFSFGMGLVLRDTLPKRAHAELARMQIVRKTIPIYAPVEEQIIYRAPENPSVLQSFLSLFSWMPGCRHLGLESRQAWKFSSDEFRIGQRSNLVNLGGINLYHGQQKEHIKTDPSIYYLNTNVVNCLKILLGFIPAFFSFFFIQDWWVLAWFGAFIWFGITGIRNVLQMVMAARGASRGTLVHWTKQVSWPRLCDSLMYTGISVLLLEVIVRVLFLEKFMNVTVEAYPFFVYTVLNCVNALYIFCHNIYRGFPRQAAIGNIFRSALSIPMASLYDSCLRLLLIGAGVPDPSIYLVPSAAIISKCASDTVAAIIEGYADGQVNLRMRRMDYASKVKKIFACYNQLELLFPKEDALSKIGLEKGFSNVDSPKLRELERAFVVNSLDLMYFWFFQPRAQEALGQMLRSMSEDDRMVLAKAQLVLTRELAVSQMLVDGLLGRNFSRPLAFFLDKHRLYLRLFLDRCRQMRHR